MSEEKITHWMAIVNAVFIAENKVSDEWLPKLRAAKDKSEEERKKLSNEYVRAIAVEILSKAN